MWENRVSPLRKVFSGTSTEEAELAVHRPPLTGNPSSQFIPQETLLCTSCLQWSPQQHQCKIPRKKYLEASWARAPQQYIYSLTPKTCEHNFAWNRNEYYPMWQRTSFSERPWEEIFLDYLGRPYIQSWVSLRERERASLGTGSQRSSHVTMEVEIGNMRLQAPKCLEPPGFGWGRKDSPLEPGREHSPADILVLNFGPPECETMNFCCFQLPGLWCLATSTQKTDIVPNVHQYGDLQVHIFLSCLCFIRVVAKSRTHSPCSSVQAIKMNNMCV